jgi:conjugal transfer pilus assembly protein TraA
MTPSVKPVLSRDNVLKLAAVGLALAAASGLAMAGADTTFSTPVSTLTTWMTGSMGKMFAVGALAVGLGIGIVKQSVMSVAVGTGIALAANAGPGVLSAIFSATL